MSRGMVRTAKECLVVLGRASPCFIPLIEEQGRAPEPSESLVQSSAKVLRASWKELEVRQFGR
jgi:hypothetical protein